MKIYFSIVANGHAVKRTPHTAGSRSLEQSNLSREVGQRPYICVVSEFTLFSAVLKNQLV